MSKELYDLAVEGDLKTLCETISQLEDDEDPTLAIYQWLQVAAALGHEDADDMAEDLHEAALSRGGDETVAVLHYEVAEWFIEGSRGVDPNPTFGLVQLEYAQELQLRESVDIDDGLRSLRAKLAPDHQERFDAIFPDLD